MSRLCYLSGTRINSILWKNYMTLQYSNLIPVKHLFKKENVRIRSHSLFSALLLPQSKAIKATNTSKYCTSNGTKGLRDNFPKEVEDGINNQIQEELRAFYVYMSMSNYFARTEVALAGLQGYFAIMYEEELHHALTLISYQNLRGGSVLLKPINPPENEEWCSGLKALEASLQLENDIRKKLLELHDCAQRLKDYATADFIITKFITEQDASICEMGRLLSRAKKIVDHGHGEYPLDRQIFKTFVLGYKPIQVKLPVEKYK